jgi:hypothetical protein
MNRKWKKKEALKNSEIQKLRNEEMSKQVKGERGQE